MKALHLFSNWKLTGPAESVLHLVGAIRARGVDALLAVGENPFGGENIIRKRAEEMGLDVILDWHLHKHLKNLKANWDDISGIKDFLKKEKIDVIHCHLMNDHHIGGRASRKLKKKVPVVRSIYEAGGVGGGIRNRYILPGLTEGIITFSDKALAENRKIFALGDNRAWKIDGVVDLNRFNPRKVRKNPRERFELPEDAFVLGIITRIQKRRRFDIILEAVRRAREVIGDFVFFVLGRGTYVEQVLERPAKKMGIWDMVKHAGYVEEQDYVDAIAAMDAKIYLGGGTDQTARAVREVMAMGKPVLVGDVGMLAEVVSNEDTGLVAEMKPEDLAYQICRLARDELLRVRLARKARIHAREHFDADRQARAVLSIYKTVVEE